MTVRCILHHKPIILHVPYIFHRNFHQCLSWNFFRFHHVSPLRAALNGGCPILVILQGHFAKDRPVSTSPSHQVTKSWGRWPIFPADHVEITSNSWECPAMPRISWRSLGDSHQFLPISGCRLNQLIRLINWITKWRRHDKRTFSSIPSLHHLQKLRFKLKVTTVSPRHESWHW